MLELPKCAWSYVPMYDEDPSEYETCSEPASFYNCEYSLQVCEKHKCRCKPKEKKMLVDELRKLKSKFDNDNKLFNLIIKEAKEEAANGLSFLKKEIPSEHIINFKSNLLDRFSNEYKLLIEKLINEKFDLDLVDSYEQKQHSYYLTIRW